MTAAEVKSFRESLGFSQANLARRLRVSVYTVQSWEQGTRAIRAPMVLMLETLRDATTRDTLKAPAKKGAKK